MSLQCIRAPRPWEGKQAAAGLSLRLFMCSAVHEFQQTRQLTGWDTLDTNLYELTIVTLSVFSNRLLRMSRLSSVPWIVPFLSVWGKFGNFAIYPIRIFHGWVIHPQGLLLKCGLWVCGGTAVNSQESVFNPLLVQVLTSLCMKHRQI